MQSNPDKRVPSRDDERTPHREGRPTIVYYHSDFLLHDPSPNYHPENPERLVTAVNALNSVRGLIWAQPQATDARKIYSLVHDNSYIERVYGLAFEASIPVWLDPDTYIVKGTLKALDRLAGAAIEAYERNISGYNTLILGRPPGHHAGRTGAALGAPTLGFCIFNTSALIARLLHKKGRVAVIDFDLHHGNGTQEILWNDQILHVDIHQDPATIYPGTGYPWQSGGIKKTKINIIIPPGSGDDIYEDAVRLAFSLIEDYDPDYLVVSAGFDAYLDDYAGMRASDYTYGLIGDYLYKIGAPASIVLEGGYTQGLKRGLPVFIKGLMDGFLRKESITKSREWQWERYRYWVHRLLEHLDQD